MKRRLALFLLLAGTFVAVRVAVAQALGGRNPAVAPLVLHAAIVPLTQLALLEAALRLHSRWKGVA
jgi:hypothetical protein